MNVVLVRGWQLWRRLWKHPVLIVVLLLLLIALRELVVVMVMMVVEGRWRRRSGGYRREGTATRWDRGQGRLGLRSRSGAFRVVPAGRGTGRRRGRIVVVGERVMVR